MSDPVFFIFFKSMAMGGGSLPVYSYVYSENLLPTPCPACPAYTIAVLMIAPIYVQWDPPIRMFMRSKPRF